MGKQLKLGELIDRSMTARQQAQVLARMMATVRAELREQNDKRTAARKRTLAARKARGGLSVTQARRRRLAGLGEAIGTTYGPLDPVASARDTLAALVAAGRPVGTLEAAALEGRAAAAVATHTRGRAAYWASTGPAPECEPGDTQTAMVFYRRVLRAIEQGGWTHSERAALYDLERKWGPRARGEDPRFMVAGTAGGRLPKAQEQAIRESRELAKRGDR